MRRPEDIRVLIACESSGRTRDAFLKYGFDAWSCDLLDTESNDTDEKATRHLKGDVRQYLGDEWDLMIAHPDCTYLTNSAEWAYGDGPYHQKVKPGTLVGAERRRAREEAFDFVMALAHAPIPRIVIENPVGALSRLWRKPDQYIQPYEYGDDASKNTCLWLKNLPLLRPTKRVEPRWVCCGSALPDGVGKYGCPNCCGEKRPRPRWANQTDSGQNRLSPSDDRWRERSKTYQGWADAFAMQYGVLGDW